MNPSRPTWNVIARIGAFRRRKGSEDHRNAGPGSATRATGLTRARPTHVTMTMIAASAITFVSTHESITAVKAQAISRDASSRPTDDASVLPAT